jgi:hypothetical protein
MNSPEPVPHERKTNDIANVSKSTEALQREKNNETVFVMTNVSLAITDVSVRLCFYGPIICINRIIVEGKQI